MYCIICRSAFTPLHARICKLTCSRPHNCSVRLRYAFLDYAMSFLDLSARLLRHSHLPVSPFDQTQSAGGPIRNYAPLARLRSPSPDRLIIPTPRLYKNIMHTAGPIMNMEQPSQKRVSKACDACKRRKVRCNGQARCQQCAHLGLRCIYSPSGKQRSQGKRGHIISEFRSQTSNLPAISPPILPAHSAAASFQTPYSPISPILDRNGGTPSMSPWQSLLKYGVLLLTPGSISFVIFHITVPQGFLSRPHPGLCCWGISCSSGHCRT